MKYRLVLTALVTLALAPSAHAQYTAPPPEPGFEYIFDGTATGSDASFDKWLSANGATAVTLDPALGAMNPNTSGFGMKWYPVRALGNVVVKLQVHVAGRGHAERRRHGPVPGAALCRHHGGGPGPEADGLQLRPLPGRGAVVLRPAGARAVDHVRLAGRRPAVPAAVPLRGLLLRPQRHQQRHQHRGHVPGAHRPATPTTTSTGSRSTAGTRSRSTRRSRSRAATRSRPARCTGSRTSTRGRRGTTSARTQGVWHSMEIRMVGQQYTVLVDGNVINQFDNSVPRVASRVGDPPTPARQFPRGYFGLQTHGGTDRIFYREIQVKELGERRHPAQHRATRGRRLRQGRQRR